MAERMCIKMSGGGTKIGNLVPLLIDEYRGATGTRSIPGGTKMILLFPMVTSWNYSILSNNVPPQIQQMLSDGYWSIFHKVGDTVTFDKAFYCHNQTFGAYANAPYTMTWQSDTTVSFSCPDGGFMYICFG